MDTRSKILPHHEVREMLQDKPAKWVTGYFDPLVAEHVRRLREFAKPGETLVIEIANPEAPLLSQRARAELVAALSIVDYVVLGTGEPSNSAIDGGMQAQFIEHVLRRHRADESK